MKVYELTYIISPELKIEEAEGFASEISALLQKEGGVIIKAEGPAPKTLSYPIKKQGTGFQVGLEFNFEPEKINTLEEKIRKESKILRYLMFVKKPPRKEREKRTKKTGEEKPSFVSAFADPLRQSVNEAKASTDKKTTEGKTEKKVELKDIEEKLEEILKE